MDRNGWMAGRVGGWMDGHNNPMQPWQPDNRLANSEGTG